MTKPCQGARLAHDEATNLDLEARRPRGPQQGPHSVMPWPALSPAPNPGSEKPAPVARRQEEQHSRPERLLAHAVRASSYAAFRTACAGLNCIELRVQLGLRDVVTMLHRSQHKRDHNFRPTAIEAVAQGKVDGPADSSHSTHTD